MKFWKEKTPLPSNGEGKKHSDGEVDLGPPERGPDLSPEKDKKNIFEGLRGTIEVFEKWGSRLARMAVIAGILNVGRPSVLAESYHPEKKSPPSVTKVLSMKQEQEER